MLNVYFRLDVVIPAGTECLFRRLSALLPARATGLEQSMRD